MNKQVKKPNVVRGGIAIPLGRNYYYMAGRKHKNGGIDVGKNPRTGLEVEDGEVMHISDKNVKVFSSVPFLNGKSPAQKVLGGENPNAVFNQQEQFKDRNKINDDGTKKKAMGGLSRSKDYKSKSKFYSKEGGIYSITTNGKTKMRMLHSTGNKTKAKLGTLVKPTNELKTISVDDIINSNKVPKINTTPFTTSLGLSRYNNAKANLFKMTKGDTISLASNIGGSLISAGINALALKNLKTPSRPISAPAAKLKTRININPQLDRMRETVAEYERNVDNNTLSSRVALARKQNARLNSILQTNELYGAKENAETELINKDKINRQTVAAENVKAYNDWRDRVNAFENEIVDKKSENLVSMIGNINQGLQDVVSRNEQRDSERQTRLAMLAAYPNVNPRILRTIGVKGITDADVANWEKLFYNKKNKQLSDRLNETLNKKFIFTPATDIKTFESFNR